MKDSMKHNMELIGITAVVLSLLFVAFQIRQSNRIAIAATEIEVSNNFASLNELMMEDREFVKLFIRGREEDMEFSDVERTVYASFVRRLTNIWRGIETAYQNGMLPESTYGLLLDDARAVISDSGPVAREIWRDTLDDYPSLGETELYIHLYQLLNEFDEDKN